jgi:hypothetical protein
MRKLFTSAAILVLSSLLATAAQAQAAFASNDEYRASYSNPRAEKPADREPSAGGSIVYYGRVFSPEGPLPGAIISHAPSKQMVVCNENGEFTLTLPLNSGQQKATISFAGFADETLLLSPADPVFAIELTQTQSIKMAKGQDLKNYMKTAHRQIKKERRRL